MAKYKELKPFKEVVRIFNAKGEEPNDEEEVGMSVFVWKGPQDDENLIQHILNN